MNANQTENSADSLGSPAQPVPTIHNLDNFTNSEIIDYVAGKLKEQGCKSLSEEGRCAYRGENGTKCAVGFLIPEESYRLKFDTLENNGWRKLISYGFVKSNGEEKDELIRELQIIHDGSLPENWDKEFERLKNSNWDEKFKGFYQIFAKPSKT